MSHSTLRHALRNFLHLHLQAYPVRIYLSKHGYLYKGKLSESTKDLLRQVLRRGAR